MAQYKVIAGTFHIKGFQPDGDSIRFQATNQANTNEDACGRHTVFAEIKQSKNLESKKSRSFSLQDFL